MCLHVFDKLLKNKVEFILRIEQHATSWAKQDTTSWAMQHTLVWTKQHTTEQAEQVAYLNFIGDSSSWFLLTSKWNAWPFLTLQ